MRGLFLLDISWDMATRKLGNKKISTQKNMMATIKYEL